MKKAAKKSVAYVGITLLIGCFATYEVAQYLATQQHQGLLARLKLAEQTLSETKNELLGYTKFTDYLVTSKVAISEQMKFLAAKIDREYNHIEHIEKSKLGIKSQATIIVNYAVEYSVGYDLKPESFAISGDSSGITVRLKKPELVASPAVKKVSHEIPSKGVFIDEQDAVIELEQRLDTIAQKQGDEVKKEETVVALCEKKLGEFLHDFLSKQPNVRVVPTIKFVYQ